MSNENKIHWINWKWLCNPKKSGGMGFWDIHAFNLAMLAKQPWRLISQQTSLFFQVYKVRYFPNGSFLDASLGSNPSYMWRSVLKARDIILVGSGDLIHIFYHQWLPRPLCLRKEGLGPMKVGELINVETRQWDRAKLAYWFEPHTCDDILHLPLPNIQSNDVQVWKENKSNSFSIKSAYSVALSILHSSTGNHLNAGTDGKLWKIVWSLNVPPKVRTFLWRACSNILPTRKNLHLKRMQIDLICTISNY